MKKHTYLNMARLVKDSRVAAGLTQLDLATAMGYESSQSISNTERGQASVPPEHFKTVAKKLKISPKLLVDAHLADIRETIRKTIGV